MVWIKWCISTHITASRDASCKCHHSLPSSRVLSLVTGGRFPASHFVPLQNSEAVLWNAQHTASRLSLSPPLSSICGSAASATGPQPDRTISATASRDDINNAAFDISCGFTFHYAGVWRATPPPPLPPSLHSAAVYSFPLTSFPTQRVFFFFFSLIKTFCSDATCKQSPACPPLPHPPLIPHLQPSPAERIP